MNRSIVVLLDTSSLMAIFQTGVDLVSAAKDLLPGRVRFIVAEDTLVELRRLMKRKSPSVSKAAKAAMKFAEGLEVVKCQSKRGDAAIVEVAKKTGAIVATTDRGLRKQLRDLGVPVIYPRKGKRGEIEGFHNLL